MYNYIYIILKEYKQIIAVYKHIKLTSAVKLILPCYTLTRMTSSYYY